VYFQLELHFNNPHLRANPLLEYIDALNKSSPPALNQIWQQTFPAIQHAWPALLRLFGVSIHGTYNWWSEHRVFSSKRTIPPTDFWFKPQDDPKSDVNGAETKSGPERSFQEDNGSPFWQNNDFLTNENTIGTNVAYTDADQAQYHYAPAENAAAYTEEGPVNDFPQGDCHAQCSEGSIDAGSLEGSAEGSEDQELEGNENYSSDFTDSEISIPYTWLLNGAWKIVW